MIKAILRKILVLPLWCIGWFIFGVLYVLSWIIELIEEDGTK